VPASSIRDPGWLDAQLAATAARYRLERPASVGTLWWYSASSVLLGPAVAGFDPALESVVLFLHPDGRVLDARSAGRVSVVGPALRAALAEAVAAVAAASGAPERALWAVATDSLANQVLWTGGSPGDAEELAASVGPPLPVPRYVRVGGRLAVRRASCCLIYQAPGEGKCVSCPRQHPDERTRRLRAALG
jgi:hypothetical protein